MNKNLFLILMITFFIIAMLLIATGCSGKGSIEHKKSMLRDCHNTYDDCVWRCVNGNFDEKNNRVCQDNCYSSYTYCNKLAKI